MDTFEIGQTRIQTNETTKYNKYEYDVSCKKSNGENREGSNYFEQNHAKHRKRTKSQSSKHPSSRKSYKFKFLTFPNNYREGPYFTRKIYI